MKWIPGEFRVHLPVAYLSVWRSCIQSSLSQRVRNSHLGLLAWMEKKCGQLNQSAGGCGLQKLRMCQVSKNMYAHDFQRKYLFSSCLLLKWICWIH